MEEMHRAWYEEGVQNFHAFSRSATLPKSQIHQTGESTQIYPNPVFWAFYGGFFYIGMID